MANYENLIKLAGEYAKTNPIRSQEVEDALAYVCSYEYYSEYSKNINIVYDYILFLEKMVKDLI